MSQTIEVMLDDEGRILIPAALRARLGLTAGTTLVVEEDERGDARLSGQSAPQLVEENGILIFTGDAEVDWMNVVQRDREERLQKVWGMGEALARSIPRSKNELFDLLSAHQSQLKALGVKRLGLFGSFVRGEQRDDSDIDVLVEFAEGWKTFDRFMELCFLLEDLFQRKVEVLTRESLSPHIGPHILKEVEYVALDG